jgi:hypothetical protein
VRALVALVALAYAVPAAAQDAGIVCDDPVARGPELVTPAVGARQVSLNAPVRVRYQPSTYFDAGAGGDLATLISVQRCPVAGCDLTACTDDGEFVPGRVQVYADELVFVPDGPWDPEQAYSGIARGIDLDLPFQFCTGTGSDTSAPTMGGIDEVTSTRIEERCDAPRGGFRVAAAFPPADDPGGPPGSIEYLLFQTRGAGIEEPVRRDRVRNFSGGERMTAAFVLPPEQAGEVICVRVAAVDGVGNFAWSETGDDDCVDPVQGNFFYPICAASAPGAPSSGLALPALAGFAIVVIARRRRRS